jgi:hypothetical protein
MRCLAPVIAPAHATATQGSAPVAEVVNRPLHPNGAYHTQSAHLPNGWAAAPSLDVSTGPSQGPSLFATTPTNSIQHQWGQSSENSSFAPPTLEYGWQHETHFNNGSYRDNGLQSSHAFAGYYRQPLHSSIGPLTRPQENAPFDRVTSQRAANRHKPKLLKMSSSMTPRQAKNKIARRAKPLSLPQKQNAAVMRKIGTCIRCKMFHVGVSMSSLSNESAHQLCVV